MSSTMRQLQGLGHSLCSSSPFHNKKKLSKSSTSINIRDHIDEQGLNFSVGFQKNSRPVVISANRYSGQNHQFIGNVSNSRNVFEVSSLGANGSFACVSDANNITVEGIPRASKLRDISKTHGSEVEMHNKEWSRVWEVVCSYFLTLDATVKITMLIFIPCCVAVRLIYGIEVLKELTPLWIFGPLIIAFDIKIFQVISWLYVFSFKQAENAIRSIPSPKKLADAVYTYILQKSVKMKSLDYKKAANLKLKEFMQWNGNMFVFFFNLSWPLYWRVVRFLTRANLI